VRPGKRLAGPLLPPEIVSTLNYERAALSFVASTVRLQNLRDVFGLKQSSSCAFISREEALIYPNRIITSARQATNERMKRILNALWLDARSKAASKLSRRFDPTLCNCRATKGVSFWNTRRTCGADTANCQPQPSGGTRRRVSGCTSGPSCFLGRLLALQHPAQP
jgi:hypothetical protein